MANNCGDYSDNYVGKPSFCGKPNIAGKLIGNHFQIVFEFVKLLLTPQISVMNKHLEHFNDIFADAEIILIVLIGQLLSKLWHFYVGGHNSLITFCKNILFDLILHQ